MKNVLLVVVGLLLLQPAAAESQRTQYVFSDWNGPAIDVHLFVPGELTSSTPVVIVIHGWSRDVERYYRDWSALGEELGFVVAVPHFPVSKFRSSNEFNSGHVFDGDTGQMRPADTWTFAAIEAVFDDVVQRTGSEQSEYTLYGHSAGSQFVHRFLWYMPDARVKRFIAANAGWYTLPDQDIGYPYGLKGAGVKPNQVAAALGKDVVLMLGREDVDTEDPNLRKTPEANAQGPNRYVRGLTMFDAARAAARDLGADFNWQLVVVDDAAHVNAQMATAAAELVE